MEFTMGSGGVPPGSYHAEFLGAEPYQDQQNLEKYGPAVLLKWKILGGEHNGQEANRICSAKMSPKSALGKLAVALKGGAIQTGERVNFAQYVGLRGQLLCEQTDGGGSKVTVFLRQAAPQQAPAAPQQLQQGRPPWEEPQQQAAERF